jgi:hypothetical protein
MEKMNMMIVFLSLLASMTFAQKSQNDKPINHLRKLDEKIRETILLGFDNYTAFIPNGYKNYSILFKTYFLAKNWNYTYFINNYLNDFVIHTKINNTDKTQNYVNFNCKYDEYRHINYYENDNVYYYDSDLFDLIIYLCQSDYIDGGIPRLINFTNDFSGGIHLNNSEKDSVSSSFEVFKNDLMQFKNKTIFNKTNLFPGILRNATYVSKNPTSFKIRQGFSEEEYYERFLRYFVYENYITDSSFYSSNNIQLLTNYYGKPKRIPCVGDFIKNKTDDKTYYNLESKDLNYLTYTDLNYAIANITTQDQIFIIDFQEGENSTILPEKEAFKKKSGGLSTGGIIAIVIPAVLILLGVGALAFFLSRRAVPPPPMKNIANNTMGVVASSEAVVHQ